MSTPIAVPVIPVTTVSSYEHQKAQAAYRKEAKNVGLKFPNHDASHIVAASHGGAADAANLIMLPSGLNRALGNKHDPIMFSIVGMEANTAALTLTHADDNGTGAGAGRRDPTIAEITSVLNNPLVARKQIESMEKRVPDINKQHANATRSKEIQQNVMSRMTTEGRQRAVVEERIGASNLADRLGRELTLNDGGDSSGSTARDILISSSVVTSNPSNFKKAVHKIAAANDIINAPTSSQREIERSMVQRDNAKQDLIHAIGSSVNNGSKPANSYNAYQQQNAGKGYSPAKMAQAYHASSASPSTASTSSRSCAASSSRSSNSKSASSSAGGRSSVYWS
jgi:hypothetical protein